MDFSIAFPTTSRLTPLSMMELKNTYSKDADGATLGLGEEGVGVAKWGEEWGAVRYMYMYNGTPIWVIALTIFVPYLIVFLALSPSPSLSPREAPKRGNRVFRVALAPVGIRAMWEMFRPYEMLKRMSCPYLAAEGGGAAVLGDD